MPRIILIFFAIALAAPPRQGLAVEAKDAGEVSALSRQLSESAQRLQKLADEKAAPAQIRATLAEIDSLKDSLRHELSAQAFRSGDGPSAPGEKPRLKSIRSNGSFYLSGNFGRALLVNNDASTYFDRSAAGYNKHNFGPYHEPIGGIGLGFLLPSHAPLTLGFEWGFDFGPRRDFDERYNDGGEAKIVWTTRTQYVMPTLNVLSVGRRKKAGRLGAFGFKFGWSELNGRAELTSPTGQVGSYTQSARSPLFALLWRVEAQRHVSRLGMGWELGYQWCKFDSIDNSQGSGIALGHGSPETNMDGSKASLDFSGWTFKLSFSGWGRSPLKRIYEEKEIKAVIENKVINEVPEIKKTKDTGAK